MRLKKANEGGTFVMGKGETRVLACVGNANTYVPRWLRRGKKGGKGEVKSHFDDVSRREAKKSG